MTNPVARHWEVGYTKDGVRLVEKSILTYCPGCETQHPFCIDNGGITRESGEPRPTWEWNGNLEVPTFSPSLLCYSTVHICKDKHTIEPCDGECGADGHLITNYRETENSDEYTYGHEIGECDNPKWGNCHSFLRNGVWEFLSDSAHKLAGQSVPMVPLPDDYEGPWRYCDGTNE